MIDLNELSEECLKIAEKRDESGGPKSDTMTCIKHAAGEVIEAGIAYNHYSEISNLIVNPDETDIEKKWEGFDEYDACEESYQESKCEFESELADVIICILIAAAQNKIDIESALNKCIEKNRKRAEGMGDKL